MTTLLDAVRDALQTQFFASGFALLLAGAVMALCRKTPAHIGGAIRRMILIEIDVVGNDPLFGWCTVWLDRQGWTRRSRLLTASAARDEDRGAPPTIGERHVPPILFTPAPGNHFFMFRGRPVWLQRVRKESPTTKDGGWGGFQETIVLRTLGRDPAILRELLTEARDVATSAGRSVGLYVQTWGEWHRVREMSPRPMSTVFLPDNQAEKLLDDARKFFTKREWYERRGIPWRKQYMFEGVPGSGKTSFIIALAGELGLDLYIVNLGDPHLTDQKLTSMLLRIPERSAVLLEDVDAVVKGREMSDQTGVTFAGLINALDGVGSKPGLLTFQTTNHAELLDPVQMRPGRVDVRVRFENATREQAYRFFLHFYERTAPDALADAFAEHSAGRSMAELQGMLLEWPNNPRAVVVTLETSELTPSQN